MCINPQEVGYARGFWCPLIWYPKHCIWWFGGLPSTYVNRDYFIQQSYGRIINVLAIQCNPWEVAYPSAPSAKDDVKYKTRCAIFTCPLHLLVSFRISDGGFERGCSFACIRIVYYWIIPQLGSKGYVLILVFFYHRYMKQEVN